MSEFNAKLDQARRRQKRLFLIAALLVLLIVVIVSALFVVSRGTRIEIAPAEAGEHANISIDDGLGLSVGDTVYSLLGNPVITISSPGFKKAVKTIDRDHLGKVFPVELFELPGNLIVNIPGDNDKLKKTTWRIDGREAALGAGLDSQLVAGRHTLMIDNPYFQPKEVPVEIKRAAKTDITVTLQPVHGVLALSSKPAGATVYLDNLEIGRTPLRIERDGGRYSLRIAAENYNEINEEVTVTRVAPEVIRDYNLDLKKAKVLLDLTPKGGTLLANGVQVSGPLVVDATVEYSLVYMKDGYYPAKQTVKLHAGEEKRITFTLREEIGRVEISSSPPANITIGGKDVGLSPVSVDLAAVPQKITIQKPGYRTVTRTVHPSGSKVQSLAVNLMTEYQARLQEAPRLYTNSAGIKLKLFVIHDSLTMGAPRSEKGQRANEFQRTIALTRPFYASLYEITNGQFAGFKGQPMSGGADIPVTGITWQEAAAYCNWLSGKENVSPFYTIVHGQVRGFDPHSDGYRLLSEGEWEWLARKAGKTQQTTFSWGNDTVIPTMAANIADESAKGQVMFYVPHYRDGFPSMSAVGSLQQEPSGLYDMAGNVSEWVHDVYSITPPPAVATLNDPLGEQRGEVHVVKGANYRSGTLTSLRPAFREGLAGGRDDVGMRIGRYLYGGTHE